MLYSSTVATFPKAIFVVAGSTVFASLVVLLLLRPDALLKQKRKARHVVPGAVEAQVDYSRGRSRRSKDIRQPNFLQAPLVPGSSGNRSIGPQSYGSMSFSSASGSRSESAYESGPAS